MKHFPAEVNLNSPDSLNQFISRSNLNISFRKESFSRNRRNFTFPQVSRWPICRTNTVFGSSKDIYRFYLLGRLKSTQNTCPEILQIKEQPKFPCQLGFKLKKMNLKFGNFRVRETYFLEVKSDHCQQNAHLPCGFSWTPGGSDLLKKGVYN